MSKEKTKEEENKRWTCVVNNKRKMTEKKTEREERE
jgi:hypothetical protein